MMDIPIPIPVWTGDFQSQNNMERATKNQTPIAAKIARK